jgi:hypothetical protein
MGENRPTRTSRSSLTFDADGRTMTVGGRSVTMARGPDDNEAVLRSYLALVAEQRGVPLDGSIDLRTDDVAALADFLDLDDTELEDKLAGVLRLSRRDAADLRSLLRRHRVAAAVGVGVLAGVPLLGASAAAGGSKAPATADAPAAEPVAVAGGDARGPADAVVVVEVAPTTPAGPAAPGTSPAEGADAPAPTAPPAAPTPAPAPDDDSPDGGTDIGEVVRYERDPSFVPPPGVDIGDAMVIER